MGARGGDLCPEKVPQQHAHPENLDTGVQGAGWVPSTLSTTHFGRERRLAGRRGCRETDSAPWPTAVEEKEEEEAETWPPLPAQASAPQAEEAPRAQRPRRGPREGHLPRRLRLRQQLSPGLTGSGVWEPAAPDTINYSPGRCRETQCHQHLRTKTRRSREALKTSRQALGPGWLSVAPGRRALRGRRWLRLGPRPHIFRSLCGHSRGDSLDPPRAGLRRPQPCHHP